MWGERGKRRWGQGLGQTGTGTGHAGLKGNEIKPAKMIPFLMCSTFLFPQVTPLFLNL